MSLRKKTRSRRTPHRTAWQGPSFECARAEGRRLGGGAAGGEARARARRAAHALRRNRIGARATSSVDVWPCQPMLALRSHVAEAAGASSSLSSRAPPSLGQDRSTPPSGAQSRHRRARGRRATRQGLLLADFSRSDATQFRTCWAAPHIDIPRDNKKCTG